MKGREVRERLQGKVEPRVLEVLVEMCEDFRVQQEEIMVLAELVDNTVNLMNRMLGVIENTQGAVDKLNKIRGFDA